jgi:hypothetical protein
MSRNAHFGIGIGILLLCVVWFVFSVFMFFAVAAGKDSRGASIFDSSFITLYVVFGGGLIGGLWVAFKNFRRALRPPERVVPPAEPSTFTQQTDLATPDEKLAHLVKKL